jgi:hypothetical protein
MPVIRKNGFVHITLRELSQSTPSSPNTSKIELAVIDTGKVSNGGIVIGKSDVERIPPLGN